MSTPIRECVEGWYSLGRELNELLYEDGRRLLKDGKPGVLKHPTYEEMFEKLQKIDEWAWEYYNDAARHLGWK